MLFFTAEYSLPDMIMFPLQLSRMNYLTLGQQSHSSGPWCDKMWGLHMKSSPISPLLMSVIPSPITDVPPVEMSFFCSLLSHYKNCREGGQCSVKGCRRACLFLFLFKFPPQRALHCDLSYFPPFSLHQAISYSSCKTQFIRSLQSLSWSVVNWDGLQYLLLTEHISYLTVNFLFIPLARSKIGGTGLFIFATLAPRTVLSMYRHWPDIWWLHLWILVEISYC